MHRFLWGLLTAAGVSFTTAIPSRADAIASVVPPGVLFEALAVNHDLPTKATPKYNSPAAMVVSPDKKTLYIAQQTAKRIDVVDLATGTTDGFFRLPDEVTGIAVTPDGAGLYATCTSDAWPAGKVCAIDLTTGKVTRTISAGFGSRSPVVTPDGAKIFICNRFSNDLSVIDAVSFTEQKRIPMVREPYCAAVTPDGKTLVVGNLLPADRSTDSTDLSAEVSIVTIATLDVEKEIRLPRGSAALTGITLSPDGRFAFAMHTVGIIDMMIANPSVGHMNRNVVSVIDLPADSVVNTVSLDYTMKGMANPAAAVFAGNGRYLCIAHSGTDEVSVINYPVFIDKVVELSRQGVDLGGRFDFQDSIGTRIFKTGRCPRTLAAVDSTVYTAGFFDDTGAAFYKSVITERTVTSAPFGAAAGISPTTERTGEALFYDARLCFLQWASCHSCHLFTRASGLNRQLVSSIPTTPKNTPSMLYSWWTPPTTWIGKREHAGNSVIAAIELELCQQAKESVYAPLDTFLMHLKPAASPFRENGRLSEAALRGKELFNSEKAGCFKCHPAPLFTDNLIHDAFVPDPYDQSNINTPSLVEIWRTAPYGHLGSMADVREMLLLPGHNGSAALSAGEFDDLVAYVLSL